MNVLEDLIDELKEENLLEKTAFDVDRESDADFDEIVVSDAPNASETKPGMARNGSSSSFIEDVEPADDAVDDEVSTLSMSEPSSAPRKPRNGTEFYKKRAVGEVSNLQMVEHVLTGVEREHLKIVPHAFDDFNAKKALNAFLHVSENENSGEHAEAEFALMTETEAWCTALAERDHKIPVSSLRQFCENSRPALSSQALLALARFYRNLPYSETVRAKFDFVITRLFSRPTEHEKRVCLFTRDETLNHINTLYREWSSIALYSADDDESNVLLTALSFEDLSIEAENASNFDRLLESDFLSRLRLFKESISELFYAPIVTVAAIECNIRIGNAYVELIAREREKMDAASLRLKYGDLYDQAVSDAAARTLALVEILRENPHAVDAAETIVAPTKTKRPVVPAKTPAPVTAARPKPTVKPVKRRSPFFNNLLDNALSVNKTFLAVAVLLIAASVGLYVWANYFVTDEMTTAGVKTVEMENPILKEHIKTARVSGETFYALMLPSWDLLPKEKRLEFLQKVYQVALEKGCKQVNLTSNEGRPAGYASATRREVVMP